MESEPILHLPNSALKEGDVHDLTLIGKILSDRVVNFTAINAILSTSWNLGNNVQIASLDTNIISCTFSYSEDRDRILDKGPWAIKGFVLNLLKWPPHLLLKELDFSPCEFWVQVHNLPLNKMNLHNAETIGALVGKVIRVHDPKLHTRVRRFIRIRIQVDTSKPLRPGCKIMRDDGHPSWVSFKYERLPDLCFNCGMLTHVVKACPSPRDTYKDPVFGHWMRTQSDTQSRAQPGRREAPVRVKGPVHQLLTLHASLHLFLATLEPINGYSP